jgi:hypothetical protein
MKLYTQQMFLIKYKKNQLPFVISERYTRVYWILWKFIKWKFNYFPLSLYATN